MIYMIYNFLKFSTRTMSLGFLTYLCYSIDVAKLWGTQDVKMLNAFFEYLKGVPQ